MGHIEIWMTGYSVTGNSEKAQKIWEGEAENFDDAVHKYNIWHQQNYPASPAPSAVKGGLLDGTTMLPVTYWSVWGCRLYDNEADARKSFG